MAPIKSSGFVVVGSYVTLAFSAAKLTLAWATPSFSERVRSTRRTQEAQVIPVTGMVIRASRSFSLVVCMLGFPPSCSSESTLCYTPLPHVSRWYYLERLVAVVGTREPAIVGV